MQLRDHDKPCEHGNHGAHYPNRPGTDKPMIGVDGLPTFDAGQSVKGSVWGRRAKAVVADGENTEVTAQAFLDVVTTSGTAVGAIGTRQPRAHLTAGNGVRYEVLRVTSGEDANGVVSHIGLELREAGAT